MRLVQHHGLRREVSLDSLFHLILRTVDVRVWLGVPVICIPTNQKPDVFLAIKALFVDLKKEKYDTYVAQYPD
jgi:hypothetical protein